MKGTRSQQINNTQSFQSLTSPSRLRSPVSASLSHNVIRENQQRTGEQVNQNNDHREQSKLQLMEQTLNRVSLQQDALMPLLEMQPSIVKYDAALKLVHKKIEEYEQKLSKMEHAIESKKATSVSIQSGSMTSSRGGQNANVNPVDKTQKSIESLTAQIKELEGNAANMHRHYEAKLKEESYAVQRIFEAKLEKVKSDLKASERQANNNLNNSQASNSSGQQTGISQAQVREELNNFKEMIIKEISTYTLEKIESLHQDLNSEIRNIYKEIGWMRCEVDCILNTSQKERINEKVVQEFGGNQNAIKSISRSAQETKIHVAELDCFVSDLISFHSENQRRFMEEMSQIREDCYQINSELNGPKLNQQVISRAAAEIEYLIEKNVNLKYQSAGTKKKFANEVKRIEVKFLAIERLKASSNQKEFTQMQQQDFMKAKDLESKLGDFIQQLNKNIEQDTQNFNQLEMEVNSLKTKAAQLKDKQKN